MSALPLGQLGYSASDIQHAKDGLLVNQVTQNVECSMLLITDIYVSVLKLKEPVHITSDLHL
jgi:hypothetical protein